MRIEKKTRPSRQASGRGHKDDFIVTDARPLVAYYFFLAGVVAYGLCCFARDMWGWF